MTTMKSLGDGLYVWDRERAAAEYASLRDDLDRLKSLDLASTSDREIKARLNSVGAGYITRTMWSVPVTSFRSSRPTDPDKPWSHVRDLWAPPASKAGRGRFNEPGKPVLYFSTDPHTALMEGRSQPREYRVLLVLKMGGSKNQFSLVQVGVNRLPRMEAVDRSMTDMVGGLAREPVLSTLLEDRGILEDWNTQDAYFDGVCTELYDTDEALDRYRLTFLLGQQLQKVKGVAGIFYPTVANNYHGANIAMPSNLARAALRPHEAWLVQMGNRIDPPGGDRPRIYEGAVVRRGRIDQGGQVHWGEFGWWSPHDLHLEIAPIQKLHAA